MNYATPFVKWVGGKRQLADALYLKLPQEFNQYHEPFVGGGALFFYLSNQKNYRSKILSSAYINDYNYDLMMAYRAIQQEPGKLILELRRLELQYYDLPYGSAERDAMYYQIREDRCDNQYYTQSLAARLIFLNKTCFNGLYRVNSRGEFNVPHGKPKAAKICDAENIIRCHRVLEDVTILDGDYYAALSKYVAEGDFVYIDPPYFPLTPSANFTSYTKGNFNLADQQKLCDYCDRLTRLGVKFMLSNSYCDWVMDAYSDYHIDIVSARRSINRDAKKRGAVQEVIVRNYKY